MADESDYSSLSLDEKLVHSVWKVRLSAYEEVSKLFEASRSENDDCFQGFNQRPELIKKLVTDSNVVAQETALNTVAQYIKYGGTPNVVNRIKSAGIITSICEKGLSSSRAKTKESSIEILLILVEIAQQPEGIIEEIIPSLSNRLPKLVAGCVTALYSIVDSFGCTIISPKTILPSLGKLFAHADKNVRAETTKLTVALYKWMGTGLETVLFPSLKPVQQKDLTKAFEAVGGEQVEQKRLTRNQQQELERLKESESNNSEQPDVEMTDAVESTGSTPFFDPADLVEPVEVLSKFPADLNSRIGSTKWKDRKEVLDEVYAILEKTIKLVNDDYAPIIRVFAKCMKDANIQVVQLAANCTEFIVRGIGKSFQRYQSIILASMIERTKEKKASVATALDNALDAIFKFSTLGDVLEEILIGMKHKTPQVKIASTNYLQRSLATTAIAPTRAEIDTIMESGVKLLSESQEPIRQASTEMIGTLMKITGERELNSFLDKIDDNRKAKVQAFFETVTVNAKSGSKQPAHSSEAPAKRASLGIAPPNRKSKIQPAATSIPAKRGATSPAKRIDETPKVSSFGRGLTGRSLASSSTPVLPPSTPSLHSKQRIEPAVSSADKEELQQLRQEKQQWLAHTQRESQSHSQLKDENSLLHQEITQLRTKADQIQKDLTNALLMAKQKETQIHRLNSDLESSKLKTRDLEQTIELMKLQQNQVQVQQTYANNNLFNGSSFESKTTNEYRSPEPRPRVTSGELSSRVKRLSIEGDQFRDSSYLSKPSNNYNRLSPQKPSDLPSTKETFEVDSNDDSWKRAAEVTSQLKARIEKMKARSRNSTLNFN